MHRRSRNAVWAGALALGAVAGAQSGPDPGQRQILQLTNQDRVLQGLQPLTWNAQLAAAAQAHAQAIAAAGTLTHQLPGEPPLTKRAASAGAHFTSIAENVAYGYSPEQIERAWMHSVPHRENILDPHMSALGVGIVAAGDRLWAVEDFAAEVANDGPVQVEHIVAAQLREDGLTIAPADSPQAAAARAACPQTGGEAGAHARFVVRWETARLSPLPRQLSAAAASGQYTVAAVGGCPAASPGNSGFTVYRVAVLLF